MLKKSLLISLLLVGCSIEKVDLLKIENGRQLLNLNTTDRFGNSIELPELVATKPDSIFHFEDMLLKIHFKEPKGFQLIAAYSDCKDVENPTVDTIPNPVNTFKRLSGCEKGLYVRYDTIYFQAKPAKIGLRQFLDVTVLTRDQEKIYRTQPFSFTYFVHERRNKFK